jgi:hypothetical protein
VACRIVGTTTLGEGFLDRHFVLPAQALGFAICGIPLI